MTFKMKVNDIFKFRDKTIIMGDWDHTLKVTGLVCSFIVNNEVKDEIKLEGAVKIIPLDRTDPSNMKNVDLWTKSPVTLDKSVFQSGEPVWLVEKTSSNAA